MNCLRFFGLPFSAGSWIRAMATAGAVACTVSPMPARADAVDALRAFVRDAQTGRATFTQVVSSPDGAKKKTSSGSFEFARPNRFRFAYTKPYEQLIVADGTLVWFFDPDLNQVSKRKLGQALGSTPAALLAGGDVERDFTLANLPEKGGLAWVQASPRQKDGPFQVVRVGFSGKALAAIEIVDSFGTTSALRFEGFVANAPLKPELFSFNPPAGADVVEQ
jgi:outer membrane lipoprotein carrier protein